MYINTPGLRCTFAMGKISKTVIKGDGTCSLLVPRYPSILSRSLCPSYPVHFLFCRETGRFYSDGGIEHFLTFSYARGDLTSILRNIESLTRQRKHRERSAISTLHRLDIFVTNLIINQYRDSSSSCSSAPTFDPAVGSQ